MDIRIESNVDETISVWNKIRKIVNDEHRKIAEMAAQEVTSLIQEEIQFGNFETLNPAYTAMGIEDEGRYYNSIKYNVEGSRRNSVAHVGSTDPKAEALEYGTTGPENAGLRDQTIIAWAQRKGLRPAGPIGAAIAKKIRNFGTVEKPAFRRAYQNFVYRSRFVKDVMVDFTNRLKGF